MERNYSRKKPESDSYRETLAVDPEISEIDAALEEWLANGVDPSSSTVTRLRSYRDTLYRQKRLELIRNGDGLAAADTTVAPEVETPALTHSEYGSDYVATRQHEMAMAVSPAAIGSSAISHQVSGSGPNL